MGEPTDGGGVGGPEPLSFDPRTWSQPAAAPAPHAKTPAAKVAKPPPLGLLIGAGAAVLVVTGGGLWLTQKSKPGPPAAGPAATQVAGESHASLVVAGVGDIASAMAASGLPQSEIGPVAQAAADKLGAEPGEVHLDLTWLKTGARRFVSLDARRANGGGVVVAAKPDGTLSVQAASAATQAQVRVVRGELDANSFYSSAVAAGVVDVLIPDFIQAFAFDFDLQREVKVGDVFEAAFEQTVGDNGQAIGAPRLLFASLATAEKSRALYRFTPPGESMPGWFDANGRNITRSLMRTPVEGARISSTFGMRNHPVLGYTRAHKGVDFATPVGTPVYASGDGVIDFEGPHGGHGNYLKVRHTKTLETAYAHLSAFGPGLVVGTAVHQGQEIARSGNTGLSSGPHLHYEVIVDAEQVDPLTFQTENGRALAGPALAAFAKNRDRIDTARAAQNR